VSSKKWGKYTEDELLEQMAQLEADPSFQERQSRDKMAFAVAMLSKKCLDSKDYEAALYHANQAVSMFPDNSTAYLARSYVHAHMNNAEAAERDLLKVLELEPGNMIARKNLKNLHANMRRDLSGKSGCLIPVVFTLLLFILALLLTMALL
jgi:tetratricopeptide (TPR) repeat protein